MVVDDETELLNTLNLLLVRIGYTVETFTNGESALNVFKKTPDIFDLVITDMTMPQMTGDKLSSEILKIRPDIPIVICSGYHETFTEKEALKSGIKKFIRKPFRAVEFSKIIQDLIGSS